MLLEDLRINGGSVTEELIFLEVKGPDAYTYFKNQTTNRVSEKIKSGAPNVFTTNNGGFLCAFYLYRKEKDCFWAIVKIKDKEIFISRLEKYHISEDFIVAELQVNYQVLVGEKYIFKKFNSEIPYWYYGSRAKIVFSEKEIPVVDGSPLRTLMGFSEKINSKLFTDSRYIDFCYDPKKGCFPGQETVAKIMNNRGSSKFPCIVKYKGELKSLENYKGYHLVLLPRVNRVKGKNVELEEGIFVEVSPFPFLAESDDEWSVSLYDQAQKYFLSNEVDKAKEYLNYAINIRPDFADAYEVLGVILGREKKFNEAIELMNRLKEVDPSSIMAHTNLSLYYMNIGEIEKAEDEKSQAMLKEFEKAGSKFDDEALKEQEIKNLERKEKMYQDVLEIDPSDFIAIFGMGEISFKRKNFELAIELLNKAVANNPKHSQSYLLLSKSYLELKQIKKAQPILLKGIEVSASQGDMMPANEMQSLLNSL